MSLFGAVYRCKCCGLSIHHATIESGRTAHENACMGKKRRMI